MSQTPFEGFFIAARHHLYGKVQKQGQQAVKSGKKQEARIQTEMVNAGLTVERQKYVGLGIYRTPLYVDFAVAPSATLPRGLIVESKYQGAAGSVDEKYPYLVENIRTRFPMPCVIVLDGDGYKSGAAEWLRNQVDGVHLLGVFTFMQFCAWLERNAEVS